MLGSMASLAMASATSSVAMLTSGACPRTPSASFSSASSVRMVSARSIRISSFNLTTGESGTKFAPVHTSGDSRSSQVLARGVPQGTSLEGDVEIAIQQANEVCAAEEQSPNCANAWDDVEELAAAASHRKQAAKENVDPLEAFCKETPEADECRVYED